MGEEKAIKEKRKKAKEKVLMREHTVKKKTPPTSRRWMGNENLKITESLANEDTTAILLIGSEEVGDKVKVET